MREANRPTCPRQKEPQGTISVAGNQSNLCEALSLPLLKTAHLTVHNDALLAGPAFAVKIEYPAAALPHINKYPTRCPGHQPNKLGGDSFATSRVRFCAFTS